MPDNNSPAAKPEPVAEPGEFDFAQSAEENPRIKRRSLKPPQESMLKPTGEVPSSARELVREAPPLSSEAVKPEYKPRIQDDADAESNAAVKMTEPSPTRPSSSSQFLPNRPPRTTPVPSPTSSPHGTRPATLYYSSGIRKDKEDSSPMKSTPTPTTPNPASSTAPASAARPTTSSTMPASAARPAASASSTRPSSVVDYRTNVERQSREQKSVGSILSILVYTLIGLFLVGSSLSGYGAWVLSKQIHQQSVTVDDLDKRMSDRSQTLEDQLKTTMTTLSEAQAQIAREQELILKQQETINKLITATDDNASALRQEKAARAQGNGELADESQGPRIRGAHHSQVLIPRLFDDFAG